MQRELVLCSHSILACKRDQVARSVLVSSPFFPTDVSSESATTSLKGNTDGYKSFGDAVQRSDDVTVDSTISVKHRIKVTLTMDTDQKTDDSSTSQNHFTPKPSERMPFAGKQIPQRPSSASYSILEEGEWSSKSKVRVPSASLTVLFHEVFSVRDKLRPILTTISNNSIMRLLRKSW